MRRTQHEKDGRGNEIGKQRLALILVKAGRHKAVELRGNQREGNEHAAEHGDLQLHQEHAEQLDGNEAHIGARAPFERQDQKCENFRGKEEADDEGEQ